MHTVSKWTRYWNAWLFKLKMSKKNMFLFLVKFIFMKFSIAFFNKVNLVVKNPVENSRRIHLIVSIRPYYLLYINYRHSTELKVWWLEFIFLCIFYFFQCPWKISFGPFILLWPFVLKSQVLCVPPGSCTVSPQDHWIKLMARISIKAQTRNNMYSAVASTGITLQEK